MQTEITPATPSLEAPASPINRYAVAITAGMGILMISINNTFINNSLLIITKNLNADLNESQWLVTGYLLAQAAVMALSGDLCNRFGTRKIFIIAISLFTISAFLCSVSPAILPLIIFRFMQGL